MVRLEGAKVWRWTEAKKFKARELNIKKKTEELMYKSLAQDNLNQTTVNTQAREILKLTNGKETLLKENLELITARDAMMTERDAALAKSDQWKADAAEDAFLQTANS